jgi:transcriptional regulator with XRE-family HTH domain
MFFDNSPMARPPLPTSVAEIAERCRLSREALGYTQATLSRIIRGPASLWGNYEMGIRRISLDKAFLLKAATGLTLEWIYYGTMSGLPADVLAKIERQIADEDSDDPNRTRRNR